MQQVPASAQANLSFLLGLLTIVNFVLPVISGYILYRATKIFATKEEINGFGERLKKVEEDVAAVSLIQKVTNHSIETNLKYIRRDLDLLLQRAGVNRIVEDRE